MVRILFAAVAALLLSVSAQAASLTTPEFSLDIPKGFKPVPQAQVDAQVAMMVQHPQAGALLSQGLADDVPNFEYAYTPGGTTAPLDSPYLMVDERRNMEPTSTAASVLNAQFKRELNQILSKATTGTPTLLYEACSANEGICSLEYKVHNTDTGAAEVHGFTVAHTTEGYVYVYWLTTAAHYGLYVDELRQTASSLRVMRPRGK